MFSKRLTTREQWKWTLAWFNLKNIISTLALETGTVNNNLIIYSMLLQTLLLVAVKIYCHMTRYKTLAKERVYFAYSTNSYHGSKRSGVDTFIPVPFNGIRNCSHMEKVKLFYIQCFFFCLVTDDDVKMNDLELHFCKNFWYNISVYVKNCTSSSAIYF